MTNLHGKRVLVTGGAGFIGSYVVERLLKAKAEVVVVDNLATGSLHNLEHLDRSSFEFVEADLRDSDAISPLVRSTEVVFHLACLGVRHSLRDPIENHEVNATATLSLIQECCRHKTERYIHVSSSEVYGSAMTVPMSERHPTHPHTVYGASKLAGEAYARAALQTNALPTIVIRPFNAYGPRSHHEGDAGEVIPRMMLFALANRPLTIFGSGAQTRDFTFVDDTARGIVLAAESHDLIGSTINIGSGSETSILDLAQTIRRACGTEADIEHLPPRPGDVDRLCSDSSLARDKLGFASEISLQNGLSRLRDWYQSSELTVTNRLLQTERTNWY